MSDVASTQSLATEAAGTRRWRRYAIVLATIVVGTLATITVLMVLIGPYGPLPLSLPFERPPMIQSQRLAFPSIVRSGKFDAFIIGSSTSRVIGTGWIDARMGMRSANVGINGATQHEQRLMAGLIARQVPNLRLLIWGLDSNWCNENVEAIGHPQQPPSEWLYDDIWWNDLPHLINTRALETAVAMLRYHLGSGKSRYPANGFLIETPPEETYDVKTAKARILVGVKNPVTNLQDAGRFENEDDLIANFRFPALAWIDAALAALPSSAHRILVLMPVHAAILPEKDSSEAFRMWACRRALADVAKRWQAILLDFQFSSSATLRWNTYWDALHVRRDIAASMTRGIVQAAQDDNRVERLGSWRGRVLNRPQGTPDREPLTSAPTLKMPDVETQPDRR